jgi:hypothetical protein
MPPKQQKAPYRGKPGSFIIIVVVSRFVHHHHGRLSTRSSSSLPSLGSFIINIAVSLLVHIIILYVMRGFFVPHQDSSQRVSAGKR